MQASSTNPTRGVVLHAHVRKKVFTSHGLKPGSVLEEKMVTFAVGKGNETHLQPQHLTTMEELEGSTVVQWAILSSTSWLDFRVQGECRRYARIMSNP